MDDQHNQTHDSGENTDLCEFTPARFPAELGLPSADGKRLSDAAVAVRQEFRDCSKWKRLRCRKVSIFAERDRGTIYVVHVGRSVEFNWTWEGAVAFRPGSLDENESYSDASFENAPYDDEILWSGEIVEVDEQHGCLFISLDNPEAAPTTGSFFVRPFEFLAVLDSVYNDASFEAVREDLPRRLAAAEGEIHPAVATRSEAGLAHLKEWWQHSWIVLWGPPGTGKTTFCRWLTLAVCTGELATHPLVPPKEFQETFPESLRGRLPLLIRLREFWESLPKSAGGAELTWAELEQVLEQ